MSPEIFYPAKMPSTKFFVLCHMQSYLCVWQRRASNSRSSSSSKARPAARAAPLQQQQQQHDDGDDDVRRADSPEWKTLQSYKMQGNMTLLQLPDGDITICSATSTQSLGMFEGETALQKALTVTEIKHYWVWNHVFDPLIFYWWISLFLVLHVVVINVQRGEEGGAGGVG